jgi:hypothetical protein
MSRHQMVGSGSEAHCNGHNAPDHLHILTVCQWEHIQIRHDMRNDVEPGPMFSQLAPTAYVAIPRVQQVDGAVELVCPFFMRCDRPVTGVDRDQGSGADQQVKGSIPSSDNRPTVFDHLQRACGQNWLERGQRRQCDRSLYDRKLAL